MDKTFQGTLQRFLDLKNCSHFNEKEGTKQKKKQQIFCSKSNRPTICAYFFQVGLVMDDSSLIGIPTPQVHLIFH